MKILKLFKKISLLFFLLTLISSAAFAQTYVSATNGDDGVAGQGTITAPYATITHAIANTPAVHTIIVELVTDYENVTVTKALTIKAQDVGNNGFTAVVMNDLVLNMTTGTDVLSFGETGMPFHNVFDFEQESQYHLKYHIDITPEIYVLDKDHKIIASNVSPEQLPEIFNREFDKRPFDK